MKKKNLALRARTPRTTDTVMRRNHGRSDIIPIGVVGDEKGLLGVTQTSSIVETLCDLVRCPFPRHTVVFLSLLDFSACTCVRARSAR